jgi:hypothetical protein
MARAHGAFANLNDNLVARYVEVLEQLRFDGFRQLLGQCCDLVDSIHFSLELFLQNVVYHGLCLLGFEALPELESMVRGRREGTANHACDWLQKSN